MAVVGEAHVVVRALTNKVRGDIRRGFAGADRIGANSGKEIGNAFSKGLESGAGNLSFFSRLSRGLRGLSKESIPAYKAFASLQRRAYTLTTLLGGLIGGINALGGSLFALAGALGAAAPSMLALVQSMLAFKLAGVVGKMAMKGVGEAVSALNAQQKGLGKTTRQIREEMQQLAFDAEEAALSELRAGMSLEEARENLALVQDLPPNSRVRREAELAYAEADLNLRRAIDRNKDVQEQVEKGPTDNPVANAMKGLNKYQQAFAVFLSGISKKIDKLREAVSRGLLPSLQIAIDNLVKKGFPTITTGFEKIARGLGKAATGFSKMATTSGTLNNLKIIFKGIADFLGKMGFTVGRVFQVITTVLAEATPMLKTFGDFLSRKSIDLQKWINAKKGSGELKGFFTTATRLAGKLGKIFGNLAGAFGGLIKAAVGPGSGGEMLLDWFIEATARWKEFTNGNTDQLRTSLYTLAETAKSFLGLIGDIGKAIITHLNTPNLTQAFEILRGVVDPIGSMLDEVGTALPVFAELVVNIFRFFGAFAQSGAVVIFFDILNKAADLLADIMENKLVQDFFKATAKVHAFALAFGLISTYAGKAFDVVAGGLATFRENLDKITMGGNPLMIMLELLAAAFVYLYQTNADFKASIDESFGKILEAIQPALDVLKDLGNMIAGVLGEQIKQGVNNLIGPLTNLVNAFMNMVPIIVKALVPAVEALFSILGALLDIVFKVLESFANALTPILEHVAELFATVANTYGPMLANFFHEMSGPISNIFDQFFKVASVILETFIPALGELLKVLAPVIDTLLRQVVGFVGNFMDALVQITPSLTQMLGSLMGALGSVVKLIGDLLVPAFQILNPIIKFVVGLIGTLADILNVVFAAIGQVASALAGPLSKIMSAIGEVLNKLLPVISGIIDVVAGELIEIFKDLISIALPIITTVINAITPIVKVVGDALADVGKILGTLFETLAPSFKTLVGLIKPIADVFLSLLPPIAALVTNLLPPLVNLFNLVAGLFARLVAVIVPVVDQIVRALAPALTTIIKAIFPVLEELLGSVISLFTTVFETVLPPFIEVFASLAPIIGKVIEKLAPLIATLISQLAPILTAVLVPILEIFAEIWSSLGPIFAELLDSLMPIIDQLFDAMMSLFEPLVEAAGPVIKDVIAGISGTLKGLLPIIKPIIEKIGDAFKWLIGVMKFINDNFQSIWKGILNFAVGIFNHIINIFEGLINFIIDAINFFTAPFKVIIQGIAALTGNKELKLGVIKHVNIPNIKLAEGGTVMPKPGGTIAQIAEAGRPERVVPLDSNGLSAGDRAVLEAIKANQSSASAAPTIVVNASEGMDVKELAAEVSRQLAFSMRKGAIG